MCACMCMWGRKEGQHCLIIQQPSTFFLETGSLTGMSRQAGWLASKPWEHSCLDLLSTGMISICHCATSCVEPGIKLRSSYLQGEHFAS